MVYYAPPMGPGPGNDDWGTRWGDALGNVRQVAKNGFTSEAYRDTGHSLEFVKHNLDATMSGEVQIDHDWELDTVVNLHAHVLPMANGSGNVYWTFQYFFAPIDVAVPAVASWTTGTTTTALTAADQYKHLVPTIFSLTPSSGTASSILVYDITRESTNALDTYDTDKDHGTAQANLGVLYLDAHYQRNSPGTATEWV